MLRLENVSCGYGAFQAVADLSLDILPGSIFALIGPNGAGKSSTIMAVAGHVNVQAGSVYFDDVEISHLPPRRRVGLGIAIAPEGRQLFPDLTVRENLIVGGIIHDRKAEAHNIDRALTLFPRLGERMSQLAGSLSGGEQQMLAIGRALMAQPRFLMIDEVSLGLMPAMVDICYRAISALREEGMTILLVEQSTQRALEVADEICVLESGRTVWRGTANDARKDPKMIDAYLGMSA